MAILVDRIQPLRLINSKFYTPINKKNKRFGSCIFLMAKSFDGVKDIMDSPLVENLAMFSSYYVEPNYSYYVTPLRQVQSESGELLDYQPDLDLVLEGDHIVTDDYIQTCDHLILFGESVEGPMTNKRLSKMLYRERFRNRKEIMAYYDTIREKFPNIVFTKLSIDKYMNRNLFYDLTYYTDAFFTNKYNKKFPKDYGTDILFTLMARFVNDKRLGSYTKKTVIVPVHDWAKDADLSSLFSITKDINIFSIITRLYTTSSYELEYFKGVDFIFLGKTGWFKVNFDDFDNYAISKFKQNIRKLIMREPVEDTERENKEEIKIKVADAIEKQSGIQINNVDGSKTNIVKDVRKADVLDMDKPKEPETKPLDPQSSKEEEKAQEDVSNQLNDIVNASSDEAEAIKKAEEEVNLKVALLKAQETRHTTIDISQARRKRMSLLNDKFLKSSLNNKPISQLLEEEADQPLRSTDIPEVQSIDEQWDGLKKVNFDKQYDLDADIVRAIHAFTENKTIPMSIIKIDKDDTSTSEDSVWTYRVQLEDANGTRHNLTFDVPKLIDNRFMRLRGNDKTISGQLINLPIIKTGPTTSQLVTNYNKIMINKYGQQGKSTNTTAAIIRSLYKILENKYKGCTTIKKIAIGSNLKITAKYILPMEYIDISSQFSYIEFKDGTKILFNQDELRNTPEFKDPGEGILAYGINTKDKTVLAAEDDDVVRMINSKLMTDAAYQEQFKKYYKQGKTVAHARASINQMNIPVICVMAYSVGLSEALNRAKVQWNVYEKRPTATKNYIKFKDGFLEYDDSPETSLLVSGLFEINTEDYTIAETNGVAMWLDVLDQYGGRIKANGLDAFYNLMMDPITVEVCKKYNLPTDYITALGYASSLLADNQYNKHTDITGNRFRTNERLAHFVYKSLATAYQLFLAEYKNGRTDSKMFMKRSAVIDLTLADSTASDLSILTPLLEMETANTVTFKGLSGLNSDRSYNLEKRTYDKSMVNKLAMSTGFAGNVGINRQTTINMAINDTRGYIYNNKNEEGKMNDVNTLSITEALTPFGSTHDDPFRTAMTFIQTSKHGMRTRRSDPLLVTNGADQALPYMTSDTFAFKAKYKGVITELTDDYMIIRYPEQDMVEHVDLRNRIEKNSDGGFFVNLKLDTDLKVGSKVKPGDIVAYDKSSYSDNVGTGNLSYNIGTLAKIAIMNTDEGFEDSAIISDKLSGDMSSDVVLQIDVRLNKEDIVDFIAKVGTPVQEGDTLFTYQIASEDETSNDILAKLKLDGDEAGDLGKIKVKSKVTGVLQGIKIYRTNELEELSPTLRKTVEDYESSINKTKKRLEKLNISTKEYDSTGKLPATGKLKHAEDKVLIEFYVKYDDTMGVGDKLVYYSALKGVVKSIFPKGKEPVSEYRRDEKVHTLLATHSINGRMVGSVLIMAAMNKVLIELSRHVKDIMGIPWDPEL